MSKSRNTVPSLDGNSEQAQNFPPTCGYRRDLNSSVEPPSTRRAHVTSSLSPFIREASEISTVCRDSTIYPRVLVLERMGSLNVTALERSLRELLGHHGALVSTIDV